MGRTWHMGGTREPDSALRQAPRGRPPADAHGMRAWLLGSGGWFPTEARETTSVFARDGEHGLLMDAGTGARRR
jgi:hypothetical protein